MEKDKLSETAIIDKILVEQLKLLAEKSKKFQPELLIKCTLCICEIRKAFYF